MVVGDAWNEGVFDFMTWKVKNWLIFWIRHEMSLWIRHLIGT